MVSALRSRGCRLAVLSSGLDLLVDRVAKMLDFECYFCNELGFSPEGFADGHVSIRVGWNDKPKLLPVICRRFGVSPEKVAVVGDGSGDAPLFPLVGLSVAFNAPPEVEVCADLAVRDKDARALLPVLLPRLTKGTGGCARGGAMAIR